MMKTQISFLFLLGLFAFALHTYAQTVTDIDGNVYNTVEIGTQVWMQENLKTTHYQNGKAIPLVTDAFEWGTINTPAYCNFNNNQSIANIYGRMYNWYAVDDTNKLCPAGWHVPSHNEWTILERAICTSSTCVTDFPFDTARGWAGTDEGDKLKEAGEAHWSAGNTGTNTSGFTALPGGYRNTYEFRELGNDGYWWTSTENPFKGRSDGWAFSRHLFVVDDQIDRLDQTFMRWGFSVRCVRDTPASTGHGTGDINFRIYPNPAKAEVSIDLTNEKISTISVYNILGNSVFHSKLTNRISKIDLSNLPSGIYMVERSEEPGMHFFQKLIIEK